jgi:hypothetical protein
MTLSAHADHSGGTDLGKLAAAAVAVAAARK